MEGGLFNSYIRNGDIRLGPINNNIALRNTKKAPPIFIPEGLFHLLYKFDFLKFISPTEVLPLYGSFTVMMIKLRPYYYWAKRV